MSGIRGFKGHPIFDTLERFNDQRDLQDYPSLCRFLESLPQDTDALLADFKAVWNFLDIYSDSPATFNRFRSETQRFLNYLWVIAGRTLPQTDSDTVSAYLKTLKNPPRSWIAHGIYPGFTDQAGVRAPHDKWRPFLIRSGQNDAKYHASQASLNTNTSTLKTLFRHLIEHEYLAKDPMIGLRKRERRAKLKDGMVDDDYQVRRLTDWQWNYLKNAVACAADTDSRYERHLFIIITMKSLFLRVSELAPRPVGGGGDRIPVFGDFQRKPIKEEEVWLFRVFGKGDKARSVTVPDAYLPYLKRWRIHLGLETPLPTKRDHRPLLPSNRGGGAISKRQVQRAYAEAIDLTADKMEADGFFDAAKDLRAIRYETHYLRHTGASQAINAGADIRHISEELGHASASFTEAVYVHADQDKRRLDGRDREL